MTSILNQQFEKIFIITSYATSDRIESISEKLRKDNIIAEFIVSPKNRHFGSFINEPSSIHVVPAAYSLYCSMESIFLLAKMHKYDNMLVFEDDVFFSDNYDIIVYNFMQDVPIDWNILNLGYHRHSTIPND